MAPSPAEIRASAEWLRREIEIISPQVIITLGKEPALELLTRYAAVHRRRLDEVTGQRWTARAGDRELVLLAAYHPSGAFQFPRQSGDAWSFIRGELARWTDDGAWPLPWDDKKGSRRCGSAPPTSGSDARPASSSE